MTKHAVDGDRRIDQCTGRPVPAVFGPPLLRGARSLPSTDAQVHACAAITPERA